jgi:polyphosphate:AMP phosphotransferase
MKLARGVLFSRWAGDRRKAASEEGSMFEAAELGRKVSKEEYEKELPKLRAELLKAQFDLRKTDCPVIVIISGADGAGKGETVNRLHEWLDPRGLETTVFGPPSDEERDRPRYWRFWRTLPARGRIGILFGSWYTDPIVRRVYGESRTENLDAEMARIAFFESMLVKDGALLLKFWFHLAKKAQKSRLEALEKNKKTRWRLSPVDWKHYRMYDKFRRFSERALRKTDSALSPWILVEAADDRYRELMVGRTLLDALNRRLKSAAAGALPPAPNVVPSLPPGPEASVTILDHVDLKQKVDKAKYEGLLEKHQARLAKLTRAAFEKRRSSVVVFEGWDAAGKGGAIRRLTSAMDARLYRVIPVAAPTDEERAHHYLWRFWRHIPRAGLVTIYDRSWYGRVLVERVEGFAREDEWMRAYLEINDFEQQLVEHGTVLAKYWLHIGKDEQLKRFKERQKIEYKKHKITDEDWRNRKKWDDYKAAVNEMVARTSSVSAQWTIVPANDKYFGRVETIRTFCDGLEAAL